MNGRIWTASEKDYLTENWGYKTAPQIARVLNRSCNGVIIKAKHLKLGASTSAGDMLTARKVSELLGVDVHTVTDRWVKKYGLRAVKKAMLGTRKMCMINFTDLLIWLKTHPDKWDSRRVDLYAFGTEPDWLKQKRVQDGKREPRKNAKWTPVEDQTVIALFKRGLTLRQIADRMERSRAGVQHRLLRIDIWGNGKYKREERETG